MEEGDVVIYLQRRRGLSSSYRDEFYRHTSENAAIEWLLRLTDGENYSNTLDFWADANQPKYGLAWQSMSEGALECWYLKRGVGTLWKAKIRPLINAPEIQTDYEIGDPNDDRGDLYEENATTE